LFFIIYLHTKVAFNSVATFKSVVALLSWISFLKKL